MRVVQSCRQTEHVPGPFPRAFDLARPVGLRFAVGVLMKMIRSLPFLAGLLAACVGASLGIAAEPVPEPTVEPRIITPGPPPSDAIVLFDGKDLDQWVGNKDRPARWKIEGGTMVVNGTGNIRTRQAFGDCQLHLEWATPAKVEGKGQGRGNSGVFLMGRYEVQVLDSHQNQTYYHGQAGSVYKQSAPLVNASRPPGEWQSFDIIFRAPRRDAAGRVIKPATITVLHNGVLIQDHFEILGTTYNDRAPAYEPHPEKLPLVLQDHRDPVCYRNIWIREL